jgi:hypothetical protein
VLINRLMQHNLVVCPEPASSDNLIAGVPVLNNAADVRRPANSRSNSPPGGDLQMANGRNYGFESLVNSGDSLLPLPAVNDVQERTFTNSAIELYQGRHVYEGQYVLCSMWNQGQTVGFACSSM